MECLLRTLLEAMSGDDRTEALLKRVADLENELSSLKMENAALARRIAQDEHLKIRDQQRADAVKVAQERAQEAREQREAKKTKEPTKEADTAEQEQEFGDNYNLPDAYPA